MQSFSRGGHYPTQLRLQKFYKTHFLARYSVDRGRGRPFPARGGIHPGHYACKRGGHYPNLLRLQIRGGHYPILLRLQKAIFGDDDGVGGGIDD